MKEASHKLNALLMRVHEFIGSTVQILDMDVQERTRAAFVEISDVIQQVQGILENNCDKPVKPRKPRKKSANNNKKVEKTDETE